MDKQDRAGSGAWYIRQGRLAGGPGAVYYPQRQVPDFYFHT